MKTWVGDMGGLNGGMRFFYWIFEVHPINMDDDIIAKTHTGVYQMNYSASIHAN